MTMQNTFVQTLTLNITRSFLRDVLATTIEGGSNYWAGFHNIQRETPDGSNIAEYIGVTVHEWTDPDAAHTLDDAPVYVVTLESLAAGVARLIQGGMADTDIPGRVAGQDDCHADYRGQVLAAVMADDAGAIDASLADLILQAATLKCIRYG